MPLPTVSLQSANTAYITRVYGTFTPDVPSPTPVDFLGDMLDGDGKVDVKELKFPGVDGKLRPIRRDASEETESYNIKLYDLAKITAILGGMTGFVPGGTVQFWLADPTDDSGKVRYKSDAFPCTVERDGQIKFGGQDYTSATLKFTSTKTGPVTWTKDATA